MERDRTTEPPSKPRVVRYMAPELLTPLKFGLDNSNYSKESDVFSFAILTYEVFPSYPVVRVSNECLIPTIRSSQESCRIVQIRSKLSPSRLHPGSGRPAQITQQPTVGYLIPSGTCLSGAGNRSRSPGHPLVHCAKHSSSRNKDRRGTSQSLGTVRASLCSVIRW